MATTTTTTETMTMTTKTMITEKDDVDSKSEAAQQQPLGLDDNEPRYGWGWRHVQVLLLFLALSMAYVFRINISISVVEMTNKESKSGYTIYDWEEWQKGVILSSFFWGYIVTQVPAGMLAVRFGPKWFLFFGVVGCSLLSAVTPLLADWGGWQAVVACRVLQGLVQGFIYPSSHAMLSRWSPPLERGRFTAIVYNGISVGTMASMAGSGELAASPLGWPSSFYVPGIVGVVWGVAWAILAANSPASCKHISREERHYIESSFQGTSSGETKLPVPWKSIFLSVPMWALIIVHCGQNFGHWILLTKMPAYMKEVLGFDIEQNGLYSSLPYLCLCISSFFVSWFAQVVNERGWLSLGASRKTFQTVAHWGSGTTLLVLGLVTVTEEVAVALLCVAVAFEAGTLTGYLCNHMDLSPNFGGAMMGVTNGIAASIAIIAPLVVSAITADATTEESSRVRWNIVFMISAGVYYFLNLFWVIFGSTEVQSWNYAKIGSSKSDGVEEDRSDSTVVVVPSTTVVVIEKKAQDELK